MAGRNGDFSFKVIAHIGVLAEYQTGWTKELNVIQWGENQPKYDIRDWSADHKQMSKGITLHKEEARELKNLLEARFKGIDASPEEKSERKTEKTAPVERREEAVRREEAAPSRVEEAPADTASEKEESTMTDGTVIDSENSEQMDLSADALTDGLVEGFTEVLSEGATDAFAEVEDESQH